MMNVYGEMVSAGIAATIPANATGNEAATIAGLNWQMRDLKLGAMPENDSDEQFAGMEAKDVYGRFKLYDNGYKEFLATVGRKTYQLPNSKVFSVFDSLIADGKAKWTSAGSFDRGAKVWGQVELLKDGFTFEIAKDDFLQWKPTALNFNDGNGSAGIGGCLERIICRNTFKLASGSSTLIKIRHSKDIVEKFDIASAILDSANFVPETIEKCRFLASRGNINKEKLRDYIVKVFGMEVNDKGEFPKQSERKIAEIIHRFENGMGNSGKTWWDAINSITEQFTYGEGRGVETRMESLWFGTNGTKVSNAFELALSMAV